MKKLATVRTVVGWTLALLLAACGGGGGSDDSPASTATSDVAVTVAGPAQPVPGGTATAFTLVVVNNGPAAATGATLTTLLTGATTGAAPSCTASGGATCPTSTVSPLNLGAVPSGGRLSFDVPATVSVGASGAISLSATVAATNDGSSANNSATASGTAYSSDVSVAASGPATAVPAGSNAVFTVVVANAGSDAARDVVLTSVPGAGLTIGTVTCTAGAGATCPTTVGATAALATLPAGTQVTLTVPAMVTAGANGLVTLTTTATLAGDPVAANNAAMANAAVYSANVSVSVTGDTYVAAGATATFVAVVNNAGPGDARDVVVGSSLSAGYVAGTVSCSASGGATCPGALGSITTVPLLPVGGTLALSIPVPTTTAQRGAIVQQLTVTSAGDPVATNNSSTATTTARDARSGDYVLHAANGYVYTLTLDADAATYAVAGNGVAASGSAPYEASSGWFIVAGNARFRTGEDVVVGGFDFGTGVLPFFAARRFVTDVAQLDFLFNAFRSNSGTSGPTDAFINAIRVRNGMWEQCNDNIIYAIDSCPTASLSAYAVSFNGSNFVGTVSSTQSFPFRIAISGTKRILLRASPNATNRTFMIGLPSGSFDAGTLQGVTTTGQRETVTLGALSYAANRIAGDGTATADSATLGAVAVTPGILAGHRTSDNANLFLISSGPFAAVVGARGQPQAGYLELLAR